MDIIQSEKLYHQIENDALKFSKNFNLNDAVSWAIVANFENISDREKLEFAQNLIFAHGESIKNTYGRCSGKMIEIDYLIVKRCEEMEKLMKTTPVAETKKEMKLQKKLEKAKKHAKQLSEELSK